MTYILCTTTCRAYPPLHSDFELLHYSTFIKCRPFPKKVNQETLKVNNIVVQIDLTDIFRAVYSNIKKYICFAAVLGTSC